MCFTSGAAHLSLQQHAFLALCHGQTVQGLTMAHGQNNHHVSAFLLPYTCDRCTFLGSSRTGPYSCVPVMTEQPLTKT